MLYNLNFGKMKYVTLANYFCEKFDFTEIQYQRLMGELQEKGVK